MRRSNKLPALVAATLLALAGGAALADTSASSAIFNSFSTSLGSVSNSSNASSEASSPGKPLRAGAYRVMEIAAATGREGYARLTLRAEAAGGAAAASDASAAADEFLFLPLATVAQAALVQGQLIQARARPYGLELAKAVAGERDAAFFLIVADDVYRELQTRVVTL